MGKSRNRCLRFNGNLIFLVIVVKFAKNLILVFEQKLADESRSGGQLISLIYEIVTDVGD